MPNPYTTEELEQRRREEYGEMIVVLDSDRSYALHVNDTTFDHDEGMVYTEGMEDGEYVDAEFPASAVEHIRGHRHN